MTNDTILIVDDEIYNREILAANFEDDYKVLQAQDGAEAIRLLQEHGDKLAVVLLDLNMPVKGGYEVLNFMKFMKYKTLIPVIIISAAKDEETEARGLQEGADDFISKPFDGTIVRQRVRNAIELYAYKRSLRNMIEKETARFKELSQFIIDVQTMVMQARSGASRLSSMRIREYTRAVLEFISEYSPDSYDLGSDMIEQIVLGSVLHDVGEIAVPPELLTRQSILSPEEQKVLESHTVRGSQLLESLRGTESSEYIDTAVQICRHHHERWDGSGYPDHLVGDAIPLSAQVVGLADTYESLRQGTLTGRRFTHDEALDAIAIGEFGAFSPILTESCKMMGARFDEIYESQK